MAFLDHLDETALDDPSKLGDDFTGEELSLLCDILVPSSPVVPAPTSVPTSPVSSATCDDLLYLDQVDLPNSVHFSGPSASDDSKKPIHCSIPDCPKRVRSRGLCKSHGGGRRCSVAGCIKSSQGQGLCIRHGGGRRCGVEGCSRGAQSNGKCKSHGGGIRCSQQGCTKSSQGAGYCRTHGGGKLCKYPGCKKGSQRKGFCATHGHGASPDPVVDTSYETFMI